MKKITNYTSITHDHVVTKGIMAYYVGQGLGGAKVGLVIALNGGYYQIKWANNQESLIDVSLENLAKENKAEFYTPHYTV